MAPRSKVTEVSVAEIVASVAITVVPTKSSALPPVAEAAVIVAVAVMLVFVLFSVLAAMVPPTGVRANAVGVLGARVSITIAALVAKLPAVPAVTAGSVSTATFSEASVMFAPAGLTSEAVSK